MKWFKWMRFLSVVLLLAVAVFFHTPVSATPKTFTFEATLVDPLTGLLSGEYPVHLYLLDGDLVRTQFSVNNRVRFVNGSCSIVLVDTLNGFSGLSDPKFRVVVDLEGRSLTGTFPVYSVPYALQASMADEVRSFPADKITGTFNQTVRVSGNLQVNNFFIVTSRNVGIGTLTPSADYALHVVGTVNASSYFINGNNLLSETWEPRRASSSGPTVNLFRLVGNVGIGTANPTHLLDVVGTVNASAYSILDIPLLDAIEARTSWTKIRGTNKIYLSPLSGFSGVKVGIGTSNPTERLSVEGGIRIGKSTQLGQPLPGTIEYALFGDRYDFFVYPQSGLRTKLLGVRLDPTVAPPNPGEVAFWSGAETLSRQTTFVVTSNRVGIGTATPDAALHIRSPLGVDPLKIMSSSGTSLVSLGANGRLGIGTDTPSYSVQVNGPVDAKRYLVNGRDLTQFQSSDSFWMKGSAEELFYLTGNVGIGTSTPRNLLELSASTGDAAITFDLGGNPLFTMGIQPELPESFTMSRGPNLTQPVLSFNGRNIGVGTSTPIANLHVSGNLGLLVTGPGIDGSGIISELPISGPGARLMFIPQYGGAFRAGQVAGNRWDQSRIGAYSVGMGYDPQASATGSVALGGYQNTASGLYSVALGGFKNEASGAYSVAMGFLAKAAHSGSFVWADYIGTTLPFSSTAANQFLVRANGGFGLNTNQTEGSAFTVAGNVSNYKLLTLGALNNNASDTFFVNSVGQVGVGIDPTSPSDLTAGLSVMNGKLGVGTPTPSALLTVKGSNSDHFLMHLSAPSVSTRSIFVVNASGNVGIGLENPAEKLHVAGTIEADQFLIVNPDNPDDVVIVQPSNGSPWADPSLNNNNTYRTMGRIGIGTPSPNSLLELSNRNDRKDPPVIAFDLDGTDYYALGLVTTNANEPLFVVNSTGNLNASVFPLVIGTENVGLGLGKQIPAARLQVSGNTILMGKVWVGTSNSTSSRNLIVDGGVELNNLFIAGQPYARPVSPWREFDTGARVHVYYTSGNVGIGVSAPSTALEVAGEVSTNYLSVSNFLRVNGDLQTNRLEFLDVVNRVSTASLFVRDDKLYYRNTLGVESEISTAIGISRTTNSGPLAFWSGLSTLDKAPAYWDVTANSLTLTSNFKLNSYSERYSPDNQLLMRVSSNYQVGGNHALSMHAELSHDNILELLPNYTLNKIVVDLRKSWGNPAQDTALRGLDISMTQGSAFKFRSGAQAVGLRVDLSRVSVDSASSAKKYAAIFKGGNVGIGVERPSVALEVAGVISTNYINLEQRLEFSELYVARDIQGFSVFSNGSNTRVGIGTFTPSAELDVRGLVSVNRTEVSGALSSGTLSIGDKAFVVDQAGNIGIGDDPTDGRFSINRRVTASTSLPLVSERINISLDGATSNSQFIFPHNLTGMDVAMNADGSNFLGSGAIATGVSINLSQLEADGLAQITGLYVDVTGNTGTRYAGVFNGGFVGIGTSNPRVALDVNGDIRMDRLQLDGDLAANNVTFNRLIINQSASVNAMTVSNLFVDHFTVNNLEIGQRFSAEIATYSTLIADRATVDVLLTAESVSVNGLLQVVTASFTTAVSVGGIPVPASGLAVSGGMTVDTLVVSDQLTLDSATLNINNGGLFLGQNSYLGVGTANPKSLFHIHNNQTGATNFAVSDSWAVARISNSSRFPGSGAGILFLPHSDVASSSIGAGIVGVHNGVLGGTDLVFVTDPSDALPAEGMRLTEGGRLGLGTTAPEARFHVEGDAVIKGDFIVDGTLTVKTLDGIGGVTINPNGVLAIQGPMTVTDSLVVNKVVGFKDIPFTSISSVPGYGQLYADSLSKDLIYVNSSGTSTNITKPFSGRSGAVPYFDATGSLKDDVALSYDATQKRFKVGTENLQSSFVVSSNFSAGVVNSNYVSQYTLRVPNRSAAATPASFTALHIDFGSLPGSNPLDNTFGRLGNGDTAIGLNVDVGDIVVSRNIGGTIVQGAAYAAVFTGGYVGVGTTAPQAGLHVDSNKPGEVPFRIDAADSDYALVVSSNGNIGLGLSAPTARLDVFSPATNSAPLLHLVKASGGTTQDVLFVSSNGFVGIGTQSPLTPLDVHGTVSANTVLVSSLDLVTLNVGQSAFVVSSNGFIGMGTSNPQAQLHVYTDVLGTPSTPFVQNRYGLSLDRRQSQPNDILPLDRDITGVELAFKSSNDSNRLNGGRVATGIKVDLSAVSVSATSKIVGLDVNVTGNLGTRYAALFNGGFVGIGTSNPTSALHVIGDIRATGAQFSGNLQAGHVTASSLFVQGGVTFNGTVTVNDLVANSVSVNQLFVLGDVTIPNAVFDVLSISQNVTAQRLGIGTRTPEYPLHVSGNSYFSGPVEIVGTLNVGAISSNESIRLIAPVVVQGAVSINNALLIGKSLQFTPTVSVADDATGQLFSNPSGNLIYKMPGSGGVTINLVSSLVGERHKIPVYNSLGKFSDSAPLYFSQNDATQSGTFQVGTANGLSQFQLVSMVRQDLVGSLVFSSQEINVGVSNRSVVIGTPGPREIRGLNVNFESYPPATLDNASTFGRLAQGETAVGVNVDLTNLAARYSTQEGINGNIDGFKYAGIFRGGNVGVGVQNPLAALHVAPTTGLSGPVFRVDSKDNAGGNTVAMVVSSNGFVGFGTLSPEARLTVQDKADGLPALVFNSNTGDTLFSVSNNVGIGTANPTAKLHVVGTFNIDAAARPNALFVAASGDVGIGTSTPSTRLDVRGSVMADSITVRDSNVVLSRLELSDYFKLDRSINQPGGISSSPNIFGATLSLNVGTAIQSTTLIGMNIQFKSLNDNIGVPFKVKDSSITGLKVNMDNISTVSSTKNTAVFLGGNVGIGTEVPKYPLHVVGAFGSNLAAFEGNNSTQFLVKDFGNGRVGLNVAKGSDPVAESSGLYLGYDVVGVGLTPALMSGAQIDSSFVVNGGVRVGVKLPAAGSVANREGSKLYFSGALSPGGTADGDNGDDLYLTRFNPAINQSTLRVNFSSLNKRAIGSGTEVVDTNSPDKFDVGYTNSSGAYIPVLSVQSTGRVAISALNPLGLNARSMLHVEGTNAGLSNTREAHVVTLENRRTSAPSAPNESVNILALVVDSTSSPGPEKNFITFQGNAGSSFGAIEGNSNGGVRYKTGGGDYAEYLPKLNPAEVLVPADVVGVINGKISKNTDGAQQVMVLSSAAAVAGNWSGKDMSDMGLVAFFGQVKVRVLGPVRAGDFVLASGKHDGLGRAVSPENLQLKDRPLIVGRAWDTSESSGIKPITVAVGLNFGLPSAQYELEKVDVVRKDVQKLQKQQSDILAKYDTMFAEQDKEIEALLKELNAKAK